MKTLLLNGAKNGKSNVNNFAKMIEEELENRNYEVNNISLHKAEINNCTSCFECWVGTPGVCVIDDYAQELARLFINSNLVIFLTPIVFGGYSYQLKKALDRMIPLVSPFFKKFEGEIHHKKRYKESPAILGIGIMNKFNEKKAQIFETLVKRNCINFHSTEQRSRIFMIDQDKNSIRKKIKNI